MLESILDRLFYESRFKSSLRAFGLNNLLEGNRISEMHGHSPSYKQGYKVELLRSLHYEMLPQALYYGRNPRKPVKVRAFEFLCNLCMAYARGDPDERSLDAFAFVLERASLEVKGTLPDRLQKVVEARRAERSANMRR